MTTVADQYSGMLVAKAKWIYGIGGDSLNGRSAFSSRARSVAVARTCRYWRLPPGSPWPNRHGRAGINCGL
jgi:hypothetical protein